jgi:hypothetical protein
VTCPTVIRVTTKAGPPGIGLPPGATGQNGFTIVKDGDTPYAYRLVPPSEVGLPQALGITASPTFAGITLSSLANAVQGIALISTTGAIQRVSIGSGLAIQGGALVATATSGGSGTVTSVGLSVPTGFSVANSPVTTSGAISLEFATGYSLPTTAKQNQWDATTTSLANLLASSDPFPVYTTGTEVSAIIAALTHLDVDITGATTQHVRNDSGATMAAGTPYHIVGTVGDTAQVRVIPARADDASTMPASGILLQQLAASGAGADGHGATSGPVSGLNTAGATEGSSIWVGLAGGISATRPATNPQVIGTFGRIHASTGSIVVAPSPVLSSVAFSGSYSDLGNRPPEISQANAEGGTATVFSLWSAQRVRQAAAAWWQAASGTVGKLLAAANTAAEARSALELGSAALSSSGDFATAAQGQLAATAIQPGNAALSDAREWSAATIEQAEAEAGAATTRRAFTAQRVRQGILGWWTNSADKAKLDGIAANATANSSDAFLLSRSNHAGSQASSTISDFSSAARGLFGASAPLGYNPTTGAFSWAATGVTFEATGNRLNLASFVPQASAPATPASGFTLYADNSGRFSWIGPNGHPRTIDATGITAPRAWPLPDRSGTIALTESEIVTIAYAATVNIDFALHTGKILAISLTGNITFTFSNLAAGRELGIDLTCDSTARTITFPPDVKFLGTSGVPTTIQPSKVLAIGLVSHGTTAAQVRAGAAAQS